LTSAARFYKALGKNLIGGFPFYPSGRVFRRHFDVLGKADAHANALFGLLPDRDPTLV
jgi:hypothetical protein